jgi:hypothetical protein
MKPLISRISPIVLLTLLAAGITGEMAYSQITYSPEEMSQLWIEGRSNVNEFECRASQYIGEAAIFNQQEPVDIVSGSDDQIFLKVEINVDSFDCGRSRMNRDLREALKSDQFPDITFIFERAELTGTTEDSDQFIEIIVTGKLTVAGETRDISFVTRAQYLNDLQVRATGSTTIRMTDFNVEPPTALMGMIRADEELTVHFDLIATEREGMCELCAEYINHEP